MTIEHRIITDPEIHEAKGITTAATNTSYKANGAGTGTWRKTVSPDLQGISGDSGVSDKVLVSDGANGFKFVSGIAHGSQTITANAVNIALTAVADTTFNTPTQYSLMTGTGSPWLGETLSGITFSVDKLTVPITGVYLITSYLNIGAFPSTVAKIALRYRINGSTFSTRFPTIKSSGTGAESQLIGFGLVSMSAGDYIQLYIASDVTGNLLIKSANSTMHLVG